MKLNSKTAFAVAVGLVFSMGMSAIAQTVTSGAEVDAKFMDHQGEIRKLFLSGTERKTEEASRELEVRVVDCRKAATIQKLVVSIVAKRFKNTTGKQKKALEYYLLVETLKHLKKDREAVNTRLAHIRKMRKEHKANIKVLKERLKKQPKKSKKEKLRREGARVEADTDVDTMIVDSEKTLFFELVLPVIKPVALKKADDVKDEELEGEVTDEESREELLAKAEKDARATDKSAKKLWKLLVEIVKKRHNSQVAITETTAQI
ncbi:MAG: hypothetical protein GY854_08295 [Deltaproteobacteria bacterium]|nr:hypothetical protein [Deltaproteobacteria bacterium]